MSDSNSKPSYAAVAANPPSGDAQAKGQPSQLSIPDAAPPPYSAGGSSSPSRYTFHIPQHPQPPRSPSPRPTPPAQPHPGHVESGYLIIPHPGQQAAGHGWVPPPNAQVAKSRAQRRFWAAFFWGWGIYMLIGFIVGGGIVDIGNNPPGRHGHWDKNGRWHNHFDPTYTRSWHPKSPVPTTTIEPHPGTTTIAPHQPTTTIHM